MAQFDIQDENGKVLFTVEGDEPPTADDVEELMAQHGGTPAAAAAPSKPDALFSSKSLFPATTEAVRNFPSVSEFAAGAQSQDPQAQGLAAAKLTSAPFEVAKGLGQDIAGGVFRLAGSLMPATRGKADGRTRTFTEAVQNPNTSLTTPIDEKLDASSLPDAVKTLGHIGLGAAQGAGLGMVKGAGKAIAAQATAGAREAAGKGMVKVADAVQNLRLGATTKDVMDGYTPRTLAKEGLNKMAVKDAYATNEKNLAAMTERANQIKEASTLKVNLSKILQDTKEQLLSKRFDFNRNEVNQALEDIENVMRRDAKYAGGGQPFVPRQPIFQLTPEQIQEGVRKGEIRFANRGSRAVPEYAAPEVVPDNFLPTEGYQANMIDANLLKTEVGKESAFQHLAGKVRGDKAASAAEKVYNTFYSNLKRTVDPMGGPELQAINKRFSELIPVQNVLTRSMTREELGQALGRTDVPTTKFGLVRAAMRATKTDRAALLNQAGESLQASGIADKEAGFARSIGQNAAAAALPGALRGSLVGGIR